jgi:predicted transposase YbfD/YdcC
MPCTPNKTRHGTWSRKKKADYVFTVKDNQPTLKTDIEDLNLTDAPPHHQTSEKDHGRVEDRSIWTSEELNSYLGFPYVRQVFCIRRDVTHISKNRESSETVYGITSLSADQASPQRILELNRMHWGIENKLHWVRDVTFDEDRSQIRTGAGPRVMASLRNLVISILRRCGATNIAKALRSFAFRSHLALKSIGL